MATRTGLIAYDGLPVASGGGHGLGRLDTQQAWVATLGFLRVCTTAVGPRHLTLSLNSVEDTEPTLIHRLTESAVAALGLYPSPHSRREYGSGGASLIWNLSLEDASAAVAWRQSLGPLEANWLGGPVLLVIDFAFRFRAGADGPELPYQGGACYLGQAYDGYGALLGESVCRLSLSSRNTLSVLFFLPFEAPGPELWQYVAFLQSRLPFRFSAKHWKHWQLTKKGTAYVGRRIKSPVLGAGGAA